MIKDSEERLVYDKLIETCLCSGSEKNAAMLGNTKLELSYVFKDFHKQVDAFKGKIACIPIAIFIAMWADHIRKDKAYGVEHLKMICDLVEKKLMPLVELRNFAKLDFSAILENIRSFEEWTISKREDAILLYTSFASWLSKETFGYIPEAVDLDRITSQKRQVPFETYINIISHLDLRERILAKMFYLGGNRGLEEVLSVKIEDIDSKKRLVHLEEEVSYPRHLFDDIDDYIEGRKKGYVFMGRDGERISHTTSFRALKKVVSDLKLDPEFTFRELTKNI